MRTFFLPLLTLGFGAIALTGCTSAIERPALVGTFTAEEVSAQAEEKLGGQFGGYDITVVCPEELQKDTRAQMACVLSSKGTRLNVDVTVTEVNKTTNEATLGFKIGAILPAEETPPTLTTDTTVPEQTLDTSVISADDTDRADAPKPVSSDNVKSAVMSSLSKLGLPGYDVFCEGLTSTVGDDAKCFLEKDAARYQVTVVVDTYDAAAGVVHFTIGDPVQISDH